MYIYVDLDTWIAILHACTIYRSLQDGEGILHDAVRAVKSSKGFPEVLRSLVSLLELSDEECGEYARGIEDREQGWDRAVGRAGARDEDIMLIVRKI